MCIYFKGERVVNVDVCSCKNLCFSDVVGGKFSAGYVLVGAGCGCPSTAAEACWAGSLLPHCAGRGM